MSDKGLTSEEVKKLTKEGKINLTKDKANKGAISIIASNIFTYFNFIFAGLAVGLSLMEIKRVRAAECLNSGLE